MAKATGYICDNCEKFDTTNDSQAPVGWLRLTVRTTQHDPSGGFDICSNKCLVQFARERQKAEQGVDPPSSNGNASNPVRKANDEGLTSVPGIIERYLRDDDDARHEPWWETFTGGYSQSTGLGYSWIVDFDAEEVALFTKYIDSIVTAIKQRVAEEGRSQTSGERHLLAACRSFVGADRSGV